MRIVEALQIDPRASWRRIARALGEHERLVSRRGTALLASKRVVVAGVRARGAGAVVRGRCYPGARPTAVEALASRSDTTFAYILSGAFDVAAEVLTPPQWSSLQAVDATIVPGLSDAEALPLLKYFRTVRGWRLGVLSAAESEALATGTADVLSMTTAPESEDPVDQALARALVTDARLSFEELARRAGVSETTARRRLEALLESHRLILRALVDPVAVGLRTEALLWLRVAPSRIEEVGSLIAADPKARYVAAVAGSCQLLADITAADEQDLYACITGSAWSAGIEAMDMSLLAGARKRGGQLLSLPGPTEVQPVASS